MTGQMLERLGYQVAVAYSGEDALRQLGGAHFDVVVSDLGMGTGMNGWELAAEVRRRWPEVRFYLATGWGAAVDQEEARERGVQGVLAKPFRTTELRTLLES